MRKYKIIDAHCHIYPDKIAEKAAMSTGVFYGITMGYDGKVSTLVERSREAGVSRCLVHSVATKPEQVSSINRFIADEVSKSGGMFIGFGALHPDSIDLDGDIEEIIKLGLYGVKLHPEIQKFSIDDPKALRIFDRIRGKLPLLVHAGDERYDMSNPDKMKKILEMYPDMTVIGAHFAGYSVWHDALDTLAGYDNLYVDCSSSFEFLTDEEIKCLIYGFGTDRVLFGSDYPMWNTAKELDRLFSLGLTTRDYEMILSENLERLLGI